MNKPVYEIPMGDGDAYPAPAAPQPAKPVYEIPSYEGAAPPAVNFDFPPPTVAAPAPAPAAAFAVPAAAPAAPAPGFLPPPTPPAAAAPSYETALPPAPSFETALPPAPSYESAPPPAPSYQTAPPPSLSYETAMPPAEAFGAAVQPPAPAFNFPAPAPAPSIDDFAPKAPSHAYVEPEPEPVEQPLFPEGYLGPQPGQGQEGTDPDLVAALNAVVMNRASDLHITVKATPMIRVDGGLRPVADAEVWDEEKVRFALLSIMTDVQRAAFEEKLELDFAYTLSESARFRVNFYQQRNSMGAAFRLIPTEIKQLAALGVPDKIGKFAALPRGLVLVTGPTGSGKSTTLAALIDLVNQTRADHIVTVEDPIEFMHVNKKSVVNQREVGADTHSFANALKHVLRQDPDVILIGELRDLETISVALTAAETGHLVFATLHTQDAAQTIDRVIDVFPPHQQGQVRAQLAATLQGVVCQTLVKKAQGGGRAVATEVLIMTSAVSNLIREGKTYQIHSAMQAGREAGMHTMDQHLADLVDAGQITHQSAYDKAHDLEDLKQLIRRAGSGASAALPSMNFGDNFTPTGA